MADTSKGVMIQVQETTIEESLACTSILVTDKAKLGNLVEDTENA